MFSIYLWFFYLYSCNFGYVAIDEEGRPDTRVFKERYCGPYLPPDTSSKNSRLVLIFNTDNASGSRGFRAFYEFIPGIHILDTVIKVLKVHFFFFFHSSIYITINCILHVTW